MYVAVVTKHGPLDNGGGLMSVARSSSTYRVDHCDARQALQ